MKLVSVLFQLVFKRTNKKPKFNKVKTENISVPFAKTPENEANLYTIEPCGYFRVVKVERIIDGDTVIVSKLFRKFNVRLDSIDCPEDGQPWGDIAKFGLIKLIGGKYITIEEHGIDVYGRTLATIYIKNKNNKWMNVNERMVALGHAWVMRRFYNHLPKGRKDKLNKLEWWSKSKKVGLWKNPNPIPPWKWRSK